MGHEPAADRYGKMIYRRCGATGLKLPALSLGAWETYGKTEDETVSRAIILRAFDLGITHFDFADNYGDPPGNAELMCGKILAELPRDELIISTKAGFPMWAGPVRRRGVAQTSHLQPRPVVAPPRCGLRRHLLQPPARPRDADRGDDGRAGDDPGAGQGAVRRRVELSRRALRGGGRRRERPRHPHHDPSAVLQPRRALDRAGAAASGACERHRGDRVLPTRVRVAHGQVPRRRRAAREPRVALAGAWVRAHSEEERSRILTGLRDIAVARGQTLAQMALAWVLHHDGLTSAVAGATTSGAARAERRRPRQPRLHRRRARSDRRADASTDDLTGRQQWRNRFHFS